MVSTRDAKTCEIKTAKTKIAARKTSANQRTVPPKAKNTFLQCEENWDEIKVSPPADKKVKSKFRWKLNIVTNEFYHEMNMVRHMYNQLKRRTKNQLKSKAIKLRRPYQNHTPKFVCPKTPAIFVSSIKGTIMFQSSSVYFHRRCARCIAYLTLAQDRSWSEKTFWKSIGSGTSGHLARYHYEAQPTKRAASSEPSYTMSKWKTLVYECYSEL